MLKNVKKRDLNKKNVKNVYYIYGLGDSSIEIKGQGVYSSLWGPVSELRRVTCHMGSRSVTRHPTQVTASRLIPGMQGLTRFAYPGGTEGRVHLIFVLISLAWLCSNV